MKRRAGPHSDAPLVFFAAFGIVLAGCSASDNDAAGSSGGSPSVIGGQPGSGGMTGGASATSPSGGASTGGAKATGGASTGGASVGGGTSGSGGKPGGASGGGGSAASAGSVGIAAGGSATGGAESGGGPKSTGGSGGVNVAGGASGMSGGSGGRAAGAGTCTASKATGTKASGTGPHQVTVETNSDAGIKEGTIFRPSDLGGAEKYPIFVWGQGACSLNGLSNSAAMAEIASHGYFVIADGTPNGNGSRPMDAANLVGMGKPLIAYIDWAIAENDKPCSAYYQSLDTTKIASNGFSCGGLMAAGTSADPRITTWGTNSSGTLNSSSAFYDKIRTPVLIVEGGPDDIAYENGVRDYDNISKGSQPVAFFSKNLGHGGDLFSQNGGDFTKIDLAWLNWWLKGDEGATGKGLLVGSSCPYCSNSAWEYRSANIP